MDVESPIGASNIDIDYILTNRPDTVTDVTVINQVNIRNDLQNGYGQHQTGRRIGKKTVEPRSNSNSN